MIVKKDYTQWHAVKARINNQLGSPRYYDEREIWWIAVGSNVRVEVDGKGKYFTRPVIILKKFNRYYFYGLPLSTSRKRHKYRFPIGIITQNGKENVALVTQLRSYDTLRLIKKIGVLSEEKFGLIKKEIIKLFQ